MNAGYMKLVNRSAGEVVLVGVESDAFSSVEIHEMMHVDGMMRMRRIDELVIPANGSIELVPGGKHLMMHGPTDDLQAGKQVGITLAFASGETQSLNIAVKK